MRTCAADARAGGGFSKCLGAPRAKKAQVSLEFLILLSAFIAFMGVWLSLILSVENGITKSLGYSKLEALASDIWEAADAVCLMGPGSTKKISAADSALEFSDKTITVSLGKTKITKLSRCVVERAELNVGEKQELFLKNAGGKIEISKTG